MYASAYIWGRVISALEKQLTVPVVSSYLDDAEVVEVTENSIVLYTPSEYRKEMILGPLFSLHQGGHKGTFWPGILRSKS